MAPRRSVLRIVLPLVIVAIGALAAVALVKGKRAPEKRARVVPPPMVRVLEVHPETVRLDVASYGRVEPGTQSDLVAQISGTIVEVAPVFEEGAYFRRGETLALVDPRDYRIAVTSAESAVAQAEVTLALQEGEARVARRDWEQLGEGEPDPLVVREPQVAQAKAGLDAARAALQKAKLDLDRTRIRAPYDGRVRMKSIDLGQFVAPGTPIGRVYSTDAIEVRLPVALSDLAYVDLPMGPIAEGAGPEVELMADVAGRRGRWRGRIIRTEGEIDSATRMLHAVARIEDPWGSTGGESPLTVGLFVEATIGGHAVENAFRLPRAAFRDDGRLVIVEDGARLHLREVEILRTEGETVVARGGLDPGDVICLSMVSSAVDGMAVRVERAGRETGVVAPHAIDAAEAAVGSAGEEDAS